MMLGCLVENRSEAQSQIWPKDSRKARIQKSISGDLLLADSSMRLVLPQGSANETLKGEILPPKLAQSENILAYLNNRFNLFAEAQPSNLPYTNAVNCEAGMKKDQPINLEACVQYLTEYFGQGSPLQSPEALIKVGDQEINTYNNALTGSSQDRSGSSVSEDVNFDAKLGQGLGSSTFQLKVSPKRDWQRPLNHNSENMRINRPGVTVIEKKITPIPNTCLQLKKAKEAAPSPTRMLYVKGTCSDKLTIQDLCNLFSNYGNIEMGSMDLSKQASKIIFSSIEGAVLAKRYLNKTMLAGKRISLSYSSEHIDIEAMARSEQIYIPNMSCRRFKNHIPAQANSVSRTLHLCIFFNHRRRVVKESEILSIITSLATPLRIQRDCNKVHLNMWFVEFGSTLEAINVLMKCHDLPFHDGNLRISFTKTKRS